MVAYATNGNRDFSICRFARCFTAKLIGPSNFFNFPRVSISRKQSLKAWMLQGMSLRNARGMFEVQRGCLGQGSLGDNEAEAISESGDTIFKRRPIVQSFDAVFSVS